MKTLTQETAQLQKEIWATTEKTSTAEPQQVNAAPGYTEVVAAPQFAQPVNVAGTAPAPEVVEVPQQRQLTWKERMERKREAKRAEQFERERKKSHAEAAVMMDKLTMDLKEIPREERAKREKKTRAVVDALEKRMKEYPLPGQASTDYKGMRSTLTLTRNAEYLERVILTQVEDQRLVKELWAKAQKMTARSEQMEKVANDFRFRNQNVPEYIEKVLRRKVPAALTNLLFKEAEQYSDTVAVDIVELQKEYGELEKEVFRHLPEEQKRRALSRSMRKGEGAEAYDERIRLLMEQKKISRNKARELYAKETLAQRKVEETAALKAEKRRDEEAGARIDKAMQVFRRPLPTKDQTSPEFKKDQEGRLEEARLLIDDLTKQLKDHPSVAYREDLSYLAFKPTLLLAPDAEELERVVLTEIKDVALARELLGKVQAVSLEADEYDRLSWEARFRQQCVPFYIEDILKKKVPNAVQVQLKREMDAFQEEGRIDKVTAAYSAVKDEIYAHLTEEQKRSIKEEKKQGEKEEAYNQEIWERMNKDHITRDEARRRYAEETLKKKEDMAEQALKRKQQKK